MCGGAGGCGGGAPGGINGQIGQIQATIQGLQNGTITAQQAQASLGGGVVQQGGGPLPPSGIPGPDSEAMRGVMDPVFVASNWNAKTPAAVKFAQLAWQDLEAPAAFAKPTSIAIKQAWDAMSAGDKADVTPTLRRAAGFQLDMALSNLRGGATDARSLREAAGSFDVLRGTGLTGTLTGNGGSSGADGVYHPKTLDATQGLTELKSRLVAAGYLTPTA